MKNLIVVMGVSGCGKTTLGKALAAALGYEFLDADDFHSREAKERMASGLPLTDSWREPWMQSICEHLSLLHEGNRVLAWSGLRREHRSRIRALDYRTGFIYLEGGREVIAARLQARQDHFMSPQLLESQYKAMEQPDNEPDIYRLNPEETVSALVARSLEMLDLQN